MIVKLTSKDENEHKLTEYFNVFASEADETSLSHAAIITQNSIYCGDYISAGIVTAVGTPPNYRRNSYVRLFFDHVFSMAPERDWVVALLHPFSFAYYRKFGFEKVSDHRVLEFPMSALNYIPRCSELVKLENEQHINDALLIFAQFAKSRNLMLERYDGTHYNSKTVYIWYDANGRPASYITLRNENYYYVNRMVGVALHVDEMVYTSRESLMALFGFIRMYEGEQEKVIIHDASMLPEVDVILKNYTHTGYNLIPDIAARILNVEKLLLANAYPKEHGHFTVRVEDTLDYTRGVYAVEYQDGKAEVRKLSDTAPYDLSAAMPAFTQMVYGYDQYNADIAAYMDGVTLENRAEDFFRAFPKRHNGIFEHF